MNIKKNEVTSQKKTIICISLIFLSLTACAPTNRRFQAQHLGYFNSFAILTGYAENQEQFTRYAEILFSTLGELHKLFDIFNQYEDINNLHTVNLNAGISPVEVSPHIIDLLTAAQKAYDITDSAVNIAMGAVLTIWHEHRRQAINNPANAAIPNLQTLTQAAQLTNINHLIIDRTNSTVFLKTPGMSLDVGAIAKGYAAGIAMEAIVEAGIQAALLNIGGHIVAYGEPPSGAWSIGIQNPDRTQNAPLITHTIQLTNSTLSTSGGQERFFTVDGQHFGHIIDPSTLMPANIHTQASVIHETSWIADILSTALFILPEEEGIQLAKNVGATFIYVETP